MTKIDPQNQFQRISQQLREEINRDREAAQELLKDLDTTVNLFITDTNTQLAGLTQRVEALEDDDDNGDDDNGDDDD